MKRLLLLAASLGFIGICTSVGNNIIDGIGGNGDTIEYEYIADTSQLARWIGIDESEIAKMEISSSSCKLETYSPLNTSQKAQLNNIMQAIGCAPQ